MAMDVLPVIEGQVWASITGSTKCVSDPVREGSKVRGQFTLMEVKRRSDNEHGVQVEIEDCSDRRMVSLVITGITAHRGAVRPKDTKQVYHRVTGCIEKSLSQPL